MPIKKNKNHTALEDRATLEDKTKFLRETIKQIFWQTSINNQRPKLTIQINDIKMEGLVGIGTDVSIIAPKF